MLRKCKEDVTISAIVTIGGFREGRRWFYKKSFAEGYYG